MRRLIEEYGTVLLYVITGIICITLFSLAFFGEGSSISKTISDSIDKSANNDISIVYTITYEGMEGATFGTQDVPTQYTKEDRVFLPKPSKPDELFAGWVGTRITEPTINVVIPEGSTGNRTYTATWTKGYYRINYNSNIDTMVNKYETLSWYSQYGSESFIRGWMSGSTESFLAEYGISPTISSCGFSFLGHRFVGWNTQADGNGDDIPVGTYMGDLIPIDTVSWTVKEITLYAKWEPIVYKIDYVHSNQAVDLVENRANPTTYRVINDLSLTRKSLFQGIDRANPVLEGYTFSGWYTRDPYIGYGSEDSKSLYRFKTKKPEENVYLEDYIYPGTTGDLVLYSEFVPNEYTINFMLPTEGSLNNLTEKFSIKKVYNVDVTLKMPPGIHEPSLNGYDFLGWVPAKTDADKKVKLDGTLEDKYIIVDDAITDEQIGYDEKAYLQAVAASKPYEITLYPVFGPHQYLIEYSANGGINPPTSQVKYYGTNLQLKSDDFSGNPKGKTQRVGYDFLGWTTKCLTHNRTEEFYKNPTGSQNGLWLTHDLASENMKDVVTLEAIWKAKTYTVTFDLNIPMQDNGQPGFPKSEVQGGYVSSAQVTYDSPYGTALKDLFLSTGSTKPSSTYKYKFTGWYEEPECIHQVTSATIIKRAENHTLYAKWVPVTYIIRLHSNY